ncbi:ABC transporter permease [Sphingobium sp. TCM1]|uniref:ABC transporter permease n=1 Tax=Sphingobium sp. TCM1 TaxID=453246 RepID=UPI0007F46D56|nr:ABC transporter permease [Sphingobium sp. TCM1]OAN53366.1 ABC transporter permease [Sphingobium sp. TCM1]
MTSADWHLYDRNGEMTLHMTGDWTALALGNALDRLSAHLGERGMVQRVDLSDLGRVDTAGALALLQFVPKEVDIDCGPREDLRRLIELVRPALYTETPPRRGSGGIVGFFDRFGRQVVQLGGEAYAMLEFTGRLIAALGRTFFHPRRLRVTPLVAMMQDAGVNALPIVFVMTFFIGAVIALVGTNLLTTLGVEVFTVQLVAVAILREFGVVIAAILLSGRSASSFAAQIGSMRMNQETDAMQVMGVDRFDALVIPRVLAALLMMPLMTFCADIGGIAGGLLVSWATIDISPVFFIQRTLETVNIKHFWIGMSKAPFLAIVIAAAGCRHGLMVGGDVQSLGRNVTSAVVQSVFMVIMFDAIFAVLFMVLDL